jgi:hypothetical protein
MSSNVHVNRSGSIFIGGSGGGGGAREAAMAPLPPPPQEPQAAEAGGGTLISMTQQDLQAVAVLYSKIKQLHGARGTLSAARDGELTQIFDAHVQGTLQTVSAKLESIDDPFLRQAEILASKHELFEVCFEQTVALIEGQDPSLASIVGTLKQVHRAYFAQFPALLQSMRPHYVQQLADAQGAAQRAQGETKQLLQAAELLEKEAEMHSQQKEAIARQFERERKRLAQENRRLREENAALRAGGARTPASKRTTAMVRTATGGRKSRGRGAAGGAGTPASKQVRDLTLKQLLEHIEAIYASKEQYDARCADAHLPRETMEQHMYTYLNQKYGLKKLIIEHATSIVKAMRRFQSTSNPVLVFAKIYGNAIDEDFRKVQQKVRPS